MKLPQGTKKGPDDENHHYQINVKGTKTASKMIQRVKGNCGPNKLATENLCVLSVNMIKYARGTFFGNIYFLKQTIDVQICCLCTCWGALLGLGSLLCPLNRLSIHWYSLNTVCLILLCGWVILHISPYIWAHVGPLHSAAPITATCLSEAQTSF